jgi:guanine deaminase
MHEQFMQRAVDLSRENVLSHTGGPFGAVIVKNGIIIAEGVNRVTATHDPTAHAEVMAIRAACQKLGSMHLEGCLIYTSCEPCPMCLGAIYWAHIKTIYCANLRADAAAIGFDDSLIYNEIALYPEKRSIPMYRLVSASAKDVFKLWMESNKKITY